jgi:Iron dependent repressor, N-terminal DNA binding domain
MRKHNGMRPQDIVILLKIIAIGQSSWQLKDLARELLISPSEVSESLNRSYQAGLIDYDKKNVSRQSLMEFLQYGLQYVFPQHPGAMVNGIPTAHAHPYMRQHFKSDLIYVWPDLHGKERGLAIEPFYPKQPAAAKKDEELYKLLALIDVIRVGRRREINVAVEELSKIILNERAYQSA